VANLARDHGLDVGVPVSLRSTNNLVVWLRPSPVVAKVSRDSDASSRELQIATFLAAVGAPVVPPIEIGLAQPVGMAGQWVTFWHYVADEGTATAASIADPSRRRCATTSMNGMDGSLVCKFIEGP